jgi:hypothetical protein
MKGVKLPHPQKLEKNITIIFCDGIVMPVIFPILYIPLAFFDTPTTAEPTILKLIKIVHRQIPIPPEAQAHLL